MKPRWIETTTVWDAEGDPVDCQCGHQHYPRREFIDGIITTLAPQWRFCEDPDCTCHALRVKAGES